MGDMGDIFNDLRAHVKGLRTRYGVPCPRCRIKQPKRMPSILLPQQRCKVDGYVDPRPRLTKEQLQETEVPCSYPDCKCIVQTSTSQPVPVCPLNRPSKTEEQP